MSYGIDYTQCSSCNGYTNIDMDCNSEVMTQREFDRTFECTLSPRYQGKSVRVWSCFHCGGYLKHEMI